MKHVALARLYVPKCGHLVLMADVGQPCDSLPAADLEHLIERGKVKRVSTKKERADE